MVASLVWLLSVTGSFTGPADASIITTGDVDPGGAATQPDPWAVGGNLYVGKTGNGTLTAEAEGVVSNSYGYLAVASSAMGVATVTGLGSTWENGYAEDVTVGVLPRSSRREPTARRWRVREPT